MTAARRSRVMAECLRTLLGLLFLATGVGKALDLRGFADVVASYRVGLEGPWLLGVAILVTAAELVIAAGLLGRRATRACLLATLLAHLAYAALAAVTLARGIALANCGCFGVFLARPLSGRTVVEDLVLATISAVAVFLWSRAERARPRPGHPRTPG